jgi:hypothetical protein
MARARISEFESYMPSHAVRSLKGAGTSEERSEKDEPALVSAVGGAGSAMLFSAAAAI